MSKTDDFLQKLRDRIEDRYDSVREFIRKAQPHDDENSAQSYAARVLRGEKPPPLAKLESWADALDYEGSEREWFLDMCIIRYLPAAARSRFEGLRDRLHAAESTSERLERLFRTNEARLARLQRQLERPG